MVLFGKQVLNSILSKANKSSRYFSIPDISHVDQVSFVVRHIKEIGEPVEKLVKYLPNVGHKALNMFTLVIETLQLLGLNILKCRCQRV